MNKDAEVQHLLKTTLKTALRRDSAFQGVQQIVDGADGGLSIAAVSV